MNGASSEHEADGEREERDDEREHAADRVAADDHQAREEDGHRRGEVENQASRRHARILHISSAAIQRRLASASGSSAFQPIFISWS